MLESNIKNLISIAFAKLGNVWTFTNPCGVGWVGKLQSYKDGVAIIKNARRVKYGLDDGSSDLIGFAKVRITPAMVGKEIAVFLSPEIKKPGEKPEKHQAGWLDFVNSNGGIAFYAISEEDALDKLNQGLAALEKGA